MTTHFSNTAVVQHHRSELTCGMEYIPMKNITLMTTKFNSHAWVMHGIDIFLGCGFIFGGVCIRCGCVQNTSKKVLTISAKREREAASF